MGLAEPPPNGQAHTASAFLPPRLLGKLQWVQKNQTSKFVCFQWIALVLLATVEPRLSFFKFCKLTVWPHSFSVEQSDGMGKRSEQPKWKGFKKKTRNAKHFWQRSLAGTKKSFDPARSHLSSPWWCLSSVFRIPVPTQFLWSSGTPRAWCQRHAVLNLARFFPCLAQCGIHVNWNSAQYWIVKGTHVVTP